MIRRQRLRGRSARYPRRWPGVLVWTAGALAATAVPVGIAYLRGRDRSMGIGHAPDAVLGALAQAVPSIALTVAAAIALAWCVRRLSAEALAYRPGASRSPSSRADPGSRSMPSSSR